MFLNTPSFEDIGYLALGLGVFLDAASIPLTPNELFLSLAGYLAAIGKLNFLPAFLLTVFCALLGHIVAYAFGYNVGRPFFRKYGKYLLIREEHLNGLEERVKKFGPIGAIIFRFIPGLRSLSSIMFGISHMPFGQFFFLTLIAVMSWNLVWMVIGFYFGIAFAGEASWIVPFAIGVGLTGLLSFGFVTFNLWRKKRDTSSV